MTADTQFKDFHWLMGMLDGIDVGLVVINHSFTIEVWNRFMSSHSGLEPSDVQAKSIFDVFPELSRDWFTQKVESVFLLNNRSFTIHEQRPYLFKFKNNRPITGSAEFMYQNVTLLPLTDASGSVSHVGIVIYDVTDHAVNKVELQSANSELTRLSRTDRLTELYNRGYWEECLVREQQRFRRTQQQTALVMFDIDHFKKVNDTYGHQAGDEVIRTVSRILRNSMRTTDIAGRYGGEEFGVILISTDEEGSVFFAERLRKRIEQTPVTHDGREIKFTISLGIAPLSDNMNDHTQWIEAADKALYQSKEGGRNQYKVASS